MLSQRFYFCGSIATKGVVTNYGQGGGATKREGGGHVKVYSYAKGRWKKF